MMETSTQHFDVVIVGSGTSAWFATNILNKAGKKVAVIDELPYGGTCALRGCQPKKYLVANAEAVSSAGHLVGKGIEEKPKADWQALQALKDAFVGPLPDSEVAEWKEAGVATFHAHARMTGENEITVGDQRLVGEHIVIAAGAKPRRSEFPGSEHVKVSDDFLHRSDLPRRIVFIGGGYISFEFAHVAIRAGAEEVTIIHRSAQPLKHFDEDMVALVVKASEVEGIKVEVNESPASIEELDSGLLLTGTSGKTYEADLVIEATGRVPNLSLLEGGAGKVESSARGIEVNKYMQSVSNPRVYAIGDVAATPYMLATVADEEGKTAAKNILMGNVKPIDVNVVPSAVFTIPNLAMVGMSEHEASEAGMDFRIKQGETSSWPSSKRIGEKFGGYKILIENGTNIIIGAHLVRHHASEVINTLALAVKYRIPVEELADFLWAYPTMTSDLKYMVK